MSEQNEPPAGEYGPHDPWAPPGSGKHGDAPRDGGAPAPGGAGGPAGVQPPPVPGMPGAVPPPPAAPGGGPTVPPSNPYVSPGPYGSAGPYGSGGPEPAGPPPVPPADLYGGAQGGGHGYGYPGYPAGSDPSYGGWGANGWSAVPERSNGLGVASLVLGIVSVAVFCLYGLDIVLGILAVIFGVIGLGRVRRGEADNRGVAIAGLVLGCVGAVLDAVLLAVIVIAS